MVVIEIDGVLINDVETRGIELGSGQRVSVIIEGAAEPCKIIFVCDPRISNPQDCPFNATIN